MLGKIYKISTIALFAICFILQEIYPQSSFEINFQTEISNRAVGGVEMSTGEYIFLINSYDYIPNFSHPYIIKTDPLGNIIQSVKINIKDLIYLGSVLYSESEGYFYLPAMAASYPNLVTDSIIVSKWSKDLELIDYVELPTPFQDYTEMSSAILNDQNQIVITGYKPFHTSVPWGYIYILDTQLNLINQKTFDFYSMIFSIFEYLNESSNGYMLAITGKPPGFISSGEYLVKTDGSLNITDHYQLALINGPGNTTITRYSDTALIATGKYSPPNIQRDVAAIKIDINNNLLASNVFGKQHDTIDFPGILAGAAIIDEDNIYIPGTSNVNIPQHPFAQTPSWFMLNKVDGDLNLKWQKFYGGDAYYFLYSIIPTSDGGCVMMGTRNNPANPMVIDAYILKVDPDGLVSVPEVEGGLQVREVILYPNPGTSQLYIQTGHDDLELHFYTANGLLHFKDRINQFNHTVNTASWPAGTYLYQIVKGAEIMDSGKWIKAE
jgi:hypothetical protein